MITYLHKAEIFQHLEEEMMAIYIPMDEYVQKLI